MMRIDPTEPLGKQSESSRGWMMTVRLASWLIISCLLFWWLGSQWKERSGDSVYPDRPIQIVVPYAAGGGSDTFVRIIQQGLIDAGEFDQPMVIINQPGGIGTIGSREVKNAEPDGYKILCHHNAIITAKLAETVDYGPEAFEPIALTGEMSMVILVRADSEILDLAQLLSLASENPESVRFAANKGAPAYYAALQLEKAKPGAKFTIVSSGGGADRYTKILGGHLDAGIFSLSEYLDFVAPNGTPPDRDVRAIAVLSSERHESIPSVPASAEMGIPVVLRNANYWWAPKDTSAEVIQRLAEALRRAMDQPSVQGELSRLRLDPTFAVGDGLRKKLSETLRGFEEVAESRNMDLPRFDLYLAGLTLLLLGVVTVQGLSSRIKCRDLSLEEGVAKQAGDDVTSHGLLAISCFSLVVTHVLAFQSGWVPLALVIFSMVLSTGLLMSRVVRVSRLALLELSLLTGLGTQYLFTEVLMVALP
ncbi:MAG: tripartite tricarboxylate transporter substrate binding protein [Rubripirellula sp.]|nr:tripartite tricarboxylate transporter substrate binding protein [Rubripirellula sp.]